ncbi:MAG: Unknown protein [uncultured Sulfurovum sp.]|uniref:DUF2442 domain-containing protein n=1 Tax=uncultured Sulfurovum sp. TaxID=269237 RepID=A0A6S6TB57_9BACT|nr:MAG: Unknown protein [uncultured Sulfurovum sp.]
MNGLVKAKNVHVDDSYLHVTLDDGRIISTPMDWYKPLQKATLAQLKNYKFICLGTGIEWEEFDYQLSVESMLVSNKEEKVA